MPHTITTRCCIVGGGPAGAILGLLLARADIPVVLLEAHDNFDREFRGDTLHPSAMEILDDLGLAERVLELPHEKVAQFTVTTEQGAVTVADFSRLRTPFPFITLAPQDQFLELVTAEAANSPSFTLIMGAHVKELVITGGVVRGVRYRDQDGWHEVRALLTVGADGRSSMTRRLAGFEPIGTSPPMDVLWFRLPRRPDDAQRTGGRFVGGHALVMLYRGDYWQIGYVFPKGTYQQLRAGGVDALRASIAEIAPELAGRLEVLQGWKDVSLLSVESNRLPRWYRPGLLLIGDAAHVMSPVGGVGINYAVQDAVATANLLETPLRAGRMSLRDLAAVQQRRELPTRVVQAVQTFIQRRVLAEALDATTPFRLPPWVRLLTRVPYLRAFPAWLIAYASGPRGRTSDSHLQPSPHSAAAPARWRRSIHCGQHPHEDQHQPHASLISRARAGRRTR
jgi:2-polyprenyl-6-methoxyphenol hydroxylase-like FAD-dependent oxidoreductase